MSRTQIQAIMQSLGQGVCINRLVTESRRSRFKSVKATISINQSDGTTWDWPIVHPGHLLTRLVSESVPLQKLFALRLALAPPTKSAPWDLVFAFDEFVPGDKLRCDNHRKGMNLSYTFLQLGSPSGNGKRGYALSPSHHAKAALAWRAF